MPKAVLGVLTALSVLVLTTSAFAEIERQKDEMTDITYVGIKLVSEDGRASLHFGCMGRGAYVSPWPEIQFSNSHFLTSSQNHFSLSYKIDDGAIKSLKFKASSDHSSGLFDRLEMYRREVVLGDAPKEPSGANYGDKKYKKFEEKRDKWIRSMIYHIIDDFVAGSSAYIRVWDYNGKSYTYKFALTSIRSEVDVINECYVYDDAPSAS